MHRGVPIMIDSFKFDLLCKGGCDDSSQNSHVETTYDIQGCHCCMGLLWSEIHGKTQLSLTVSWT